MSDFGEKLSAKELSLKGYLIHKEQEGLLLGGVGFDVLVSEKISLNLRSTYRFSEEKGTYKHLQHMVGFNYNFGQGDSDKDGMSQTKKIPVQRNRA